MEGGKGRGPRWAVIAHEVFWVAVVDAPDTLEDRQPIQHAADVKWTQRRACNNFLHAQGPSTQAAQERFVDPYGPHPGRLLELRRAEAAADGPAWPFAAACDFAAESAPGRTVGSAS